MPVTVSSFSPTTELSGGHAGLNRQKGSKSYATITGTGLTNGLPVEVHSPAESRRPNLKWTGTTANSNADNTQCDAELIEQLEHISEDGSGTVSVTVGDSPPPKPKRTFLGTA
jgi:hypothetical protein